MLGVSESKIRLVDLTRHRIENHQENYLRNVKRNNEKTYMLKMNIQNINEIGHRMEELR